MHILSEFFRVYMNVIQKVTYKVSYIYGKNNREIYYWQYIIEKHLKMLFNNKLSHQDTRVVFNDNTSGVSCAEERLF